MEETTFRPPDFRLAGALAARSLSGVMALMTSAAFSSVGAWSRTTSGAAAAASDVPPSRDWAPQAVVAASSAPAASVVRIRVFKGGAPSGVLPADFAADDSGHDLGAQHRVRRLHEGVGVHGDEVGELAGGEDALAVLLARGVGRAEGVGGEGLAHAQPLLGLPATGGRAVGAGTGHRGVQRG